MSSDSYVFDMASQADVTPQVFLKKDWLSILDNQNGNYSGNQCVLDTSQLANSNKYMNYREGYLSVPLVLAISTLANAGPAGILPATAATSCDFAVGLKNWYGSIIHSFSLEYNGTTIVQQTPFIGMWNCFKLMTTLNFDDLLTQGPSIGFYPDTANAVSFSAAWTTSGLGTSNCANAISFPVVSGALSGLAVSNQGLLQRQLMTNFNPAGLTAIASDAFSTLMSAASLQLAWKSYISSTINVTTAINGVWVCSIMAQIKLKHIHSFFERAPLIKGAFMKMTLALNQTAVTITTTGTNVWSAVSVNSPLGGVSPIMLASSVAANGGRDCWTGAAASTVSISVGNKVLGSQASLNLVGVLGQSVQLYVPAYSFNPIFETSYLSVPVKEVNYTDLYQYTVVNITAGQTFNNLISNGIANIKSVLVLPFYTTTANAAVNPILSPFDPAGAGPTSPLCLLGNYNVQISGQNAIYNQQKYSFEAFMNQLAGVNATNGGQTDGLTSGLISQADFENEYCYHYVNVGRCLPVEENIPKSVSIQGTNLSAKAIDLYVFCEYGTKIAIDILSGARV